MDTIIIAALTYGFFGTIGVGFGLWALWAFLAILYVWFF